MNHDGDDRQKGKKRRVPQHQVSIENRNIHEEVNHGEQLLNPSDDHSPVEHVFRDFSKRTVSVVAVVEVQFF